MLRLRRSRSSPRSSPPFLAGARIVLALFGVGLAVWLIVGALSELAFRVRLGTVPLGDSLRRARRPAALRLRHDPRPCRRSA